MMICCSRNISVYTLPHLSLTGMVKDSETRITASGLAPPPLLPTSGLRPPGIRCAAEACQGPSHARMHTSGGMCRF